MNQVDYERWIDPTNAEKSFQQDGKDYRILGVRKVEYGAKTYWQLRVARYKPRAYWALTWKTLEEVPDNIRLISMFLVKSRPGRSEAEAFQPELPS